MSNEIKNREKDVNNNYNNPIEFEGILSGGECAIH